MMSLNALSSRVSAVFRRLGRPAAERAEAKARHIVEGYYSYSQSGTLRPTFFQPWFLGLLNDLLSWRQFLWGSQFLSAHKLSGGSLLVTANEDSLHKHDRVQFVCVKLFRVLPYRFEVSYDCVKGIISLQPREPRFWSMLEVLHNATKGLSIELKNFEKFLIPTALWLDDTKYLEQISAKYKTALDELHPEYSWADIHNLYFHSEVFASDHGFDGIPGEYLRKMLSVPENVGLRGRS